VDRAAQIAALLRFDRPLPELQSALRALEPDAEPVATLTRGHILAVLKRFQAGELDAATVERWAAMVESREDIEFEPRHAETIADALFDLANPDLQGALETLIPDLVADLS